MKKVIIVLLITVLVAGFAFAGEFHGYAGISFGVDFDAKDWGFDNYTFGQYEFNFELDTTPVAIGEDHETDVWAELAAEAKAWIGLEPNTPNENMLVNEAFVFPMYSAKITKANIHVGEITFGILNAGNAADYAKSYYKVRAIRNRQYDTVQCIGTAPGFTVEYDGWKGGFGAEGAWNEEGKEDDVYNIFAHFEAKTFKFVDEQLSVDAGVYAFITDKNTFFEAAAEEEVLLSNLGGGFKVAYEADKLSASLATDLQLLLVPEIKMGDVVVIEKDSQFVFEAAAKAKYDFVTLDVYATPYAMVSLLDATYDEVVEDNDKAIKLDAKVSAEYTFGLSDDIDLKVDGYVEVREALIKALVLYAGSSQSTTVDAFTFELSEDVEVDNLANDEKVAVGLDLGAKVTYTHEKFEAYGAVSTSFDFSADDAFQALGVEAGISSEAIVEGAVLEFVYTNNMDLDAGIAFKDTKGSVTASCTINF